MAGPLKGILTRESSTDQGTFGIFALGDLVLYSLELPWKDNQPNVSCIPVGVYSATMTFSQRFKKQMYLIETIPDRGGIRIHSANFAGDDTKGFKRQLNGCIALGEKVGIMDGQRALLLSKPAIRRLEALTLGKPFTLEIINV